MSKGEAREPIMEVDIPDCPHCAIMVVLECFPDLDVLEQLNAIMLAAGDTIRQRPRGEQADLLRQFEQAWARMRSEVLQGDWEDITGKTHEGTETKQ